MPFTPLKEKRDDEEQSLIDQALALEGITGDKAEIVKSIYQQESGSGANTKTSNRGAVGGMQIIPSTFESVADDGWDIHDPLDNARAGARYASKMYELAEGDPALTAAGYYGGEGGLEKARRGIAVSDPKNPNNPNTLEYGQQVASRLGNDLNNNAARRTGFTPLEEEERPSVATRKAGFTPLEPDATEPEEENGAYKTLKAIGSVYPIAETAANFASQVVALPASGLAGLGTLATGGSVDEASENIAKTAEALTYQPRTELGEHLTKAAMYPFEKLAEAGHWAGQKTLDATGSPIAATAVDTAINVAPMAIGAGKPKGVLTEAAEIAELNKPKPEPVPQAAHVDAPVMQTMPLNSESVAARAATPENLPTEPIHSNVNALEATNPEAAARFHDAGEASVLPESFNAPERAVEMPHLTEKPNIGEKMPLFAEKSIEQPDASLYSLETSAKQSPDQQRALFDEAQQRDVLAETKVDEPLPESVLNRPENTDLSLNEIADARNAMAAGENYVGLGIDRAETSGVLTDKPIRREDVLIPFMKALDSTVYEGRVKGKNRLGFYQPKLEAVRIKNKSDLEVAAHEMAHLIDDRVPEISRSWKEGEKAKIYANELRGVSYDKKKVYEGFAEFTRLYMTQPEVARAKAPEFSMFFDDFTNKHPYGEAIKKAQQGMTSWFNQDALHRAQSKIGLQKDINAPLNGLFDKFRQSTVDDLHGIYKMERDLMGKTSAMGAYETARNTRGAGAMIDGAIRLGAPIKRADGSFGFHGKGLEKILEPVTDHLEQFLMYSVGRSARELMYQGREKLFTQAEIKAMVNLETPVFRKAFNEYQNFNKSVLDFAEVQGVINPGVRQLFNRQHYLPFYRAGQSTAQKSAGGVTGNWSGIKKLTGGDENLRPILGNMIQNTAMLMEAALKNEARLKVVELANQKGGGKFLVKIDAYSRPVKINREQVREELLKASGLDPAAIRRGALDAEQAKVVKAVDQALTQAPDFFEFMLQNQAPAGNIMAVLKNGKPEYYEIADPLLYRAVSSLNRPAQNWLVNLLGWPKRIGQAAITFTPDFMITNLARDTLMATVMSKSGFKPFVDSVRGMASRITSDPMYQEFIANGGGFSSYLRDEGTFKSHLERFYTSKGINAKTVLDTPDKLMYGIETIADAIEMSSRLGEYKRLRAQGEHPRHAAYAAREISTDFAMKGDSRELGFLYDTVMFLRPAVVSWDRFARGLAHDENRAAIAGKAGTLALMSAGLYLLNRDNPEYTDLPDWDKDTAWHFFVPQSDGSTVHLRYPKIFEIGALGSIAERTIAKLMDDDPKLGASVARIIKNTFHLNLMPQAVAPLYEQAVNRNEFTDTPIETPGMEHLQPFLRAKPSTSETMKAAGMATGNLPEGAQIAPARAEALLRGYFGTWAMYGLMISDQAFFSEKLPTMRNDEMPVARRFYAQTPTRHTKYETMFYDMLEESQRLHGTIKQLDATGEIEKADKLAAEPLASRYRQLNHANSSLQEINKRMTQIRVSNLSRDEKRQELDSLMLERNALLKNAALDGAERKRSGFVPIE